MRLFIRTSARRRTGLGRASHAAGASRERRGPRSRALAERGWGRWPPDGSGDVPAPGAHRATSCHVVRQLVRVTSRRVTSHGTAAHRRGAFGPRRAAAQQWPLGWPHPAAGWPKGMGTRSPGHRQGPCPCVQGSGMCSRTSHGPSCSQTVLRSPSRREGAALGEPRLSKRPRISRAAGAMGRPGTIPAPSPGERPLGGSGRSRCLQKPRCCYPHIRSIYTLIEFFITEL